MRRSSFSSASTRSRWSPRYQEQEELSTKTERRGNKNLLLKASSMTNFLNFLTFLIFYFNSFSLFVKETMTLTYQATKELYYCRLRTPKDESYFVYFTFESHEGLCYYSTMEESLG